MSELPLDANGNPIYPEGMIEAHTAFIAHFNEDKGDGMHGRAKRALDAALPLLKKAWLLEQQKDHSTSTNHQEAAELALSRAATSNIARCYLDLRQRLDEACQEGGLNKPERIDEVPRLLATILVGTRRSRDTLQTLLDAAGDALGMGRSESGVRAYTTEGLRRHGERIRGQERSMDTALATIRETREILGASPTGTVQQAASEIREIIGASPTVMDAARDLKRKLIDMEFQVRRCVAPLGFAKDAPVDVIISGVLNEIQRERTCIRYVQEQLLQIEDCFDGGAPVEALARRVVAAWKEIDKAVGFHGPPFPTLLSRVNALNMRAGVEQKAGMVAERRFHAVCDALAGLLSALSHLHCDADSPITKAARAASGALGEVTRGGAPPKTDDDELNEVMEALQEATTGLAEVIDEWPEEPTWQSRLKWLVNRAKLAEQHPTSVRIMAVVESFAKHADDSGWHSTADELRRKAAEALNGAGDTDPLPRIVTDAMIASAVHYLHANGIDMLNRNLLGLLAVVVRAKP